MQAYKEDARIIFSALLNRGYPHQLVTQGYIKAKETDRALLLGEQLKNPTQRLVLSTTHHYANPPWNNIIRSHQPTLEALPSSSQVAQLQMTTAFKANRTLRNILVRAKLQQNDSPPLTLGTHPCGRQCFCCKYICSSQSSQSKVKSHHNGKTYNSRGSGNCRTSGVVYLLECRVCHIQYVGQIGNALKTRISNHLSSIRREDDELPVAIHFNSSRHTINDVTVRIIDIPGNQIQKRLSYEQAWIDSLQTLQPWGLNLIE